MPGKNRIRLLMVMMVITRCMYPQEPWDQSQHAEEILFRDETAEIPAEVYETRVDLVSQPLNLNTATPDQLEESGLFTPFQIHSLLGYREKYGMFYSVYELAGVAGFRGSVLREITPFLTAVPGKVTDTRIAGKGLILITLGKTVPESIGYLPDGKNRNEKTYTGSPLKTSIRIKSPPGRSLAMGLTYEKDPGERMVHERRPEYLSGYLSYRGHKRIKHLVVGTFQLHHGLGLVNGIGFLNSPESFLIKRHPILSLKPYASTRENRFERGAGCLLDLKRAELLVWSAFQSLDLSLYNFGDTSGQINWMEFRRTTGLHRTTSEMNGRGLAYRYHTGIQAIVRQGNLHAGVMIGFEGTGLTPTGIDSLGAGMRSAVHELLSLHGQWFRDRIELFGEIATGTWDSPALQTGLKYHFSDFLQGLILYHYFDPDYRGIHPSSFASGSRIGNEHGMAIQMHVEPGSLFTADFTAELFRFPAPRYLSIVPSGGYSYSFTFNNTQHINQQWRIRFTRKSWLRTPDTEGTGLPPSKNVEITRLDLRLGDQRNINLSWQTRMTVSWLQAEGRRSPGYAVVQQLGMNPLPQLKFTMQFVVFSVAEWDNRIYLHEPGLYYSFNFPVLYGSGQKVTSVLSLKTGKRMTLSAKSSVITYTDRKETGSGNDLILGNKKWEVGVQLRLSL